MKTTRSGETLFTTTYVDAETGDVGLELRVDVRTGRTALDPRHLYPSFWIPVVEGDERPMSELEDALRAVRNPSIEVEPELRQIHV